MPTPQGWECVQDAYQACADANPESFNQFCPCMCANEAIIYICNSNHHTDDNFYIRLNGDLIGTLNLISEPYGPEYCSESPAPGGWWSTDPAITPESIGSTPEGACYEPNAPQDLNWSCCVGGLVTYTLPKSRLVEGKNTLLMENSSINNEGNFGSIGVYKVDSNGYICKRVIDEYYSGYDGEDFDFEFEWTWNAQCGEAPALYQRSLYLNTKHGVYLDKKYLKDLVNYKKNNNSILERQKKQCLMKSLYEGKTYEEGKTFKKELIDLRKELLKTHSVKEADVEIQKKILSLSGRPFPKQSSSKIATTPTEDCNCRRKIPVRKNIKLN